jgi:hypothetical protein
LRTHAEFPVRQDALLVSINDRLGGKPGQDIAPLGTAWEADLWQLAAEDFKPDVWDALAALEDEV